MFGLTGTLNYYLCDGFIDTRSGIDGLSKYDRIMRLSSKFEKKFLFLEIFYCQKEGFSMIN